MARLARLAIRHGFKCTVHKDYIAIDVPYINNGIEGIEIFVAYTYEECRAILGY